MATRHPLPPLGDSTFDSAQHSGAHSELDKNIALRGAGGCGKTATVIQHIAYRLSTNAEDSSHLLHRMVVYVPTPTAVGVFRDRLRDYFAQCQDLDPDFWGGISLDWLTVLPITDFFAPPVGKDILFIDGWECLSPAQKEVVSHLSDCRLFVTGTTLVGLDCPHTPLALSHNYRSDTGLLALLSTVLPTDAVGTKVYNDYLAQYPYKFYRPSYISHEDMRLPALVAELRRTQNRLDYEEEHQISTTDEGRTMAILVPEEWQVDYLARGCAGRGLPILCHGQDAPPALLDLKSLILGFIHPQREDVLYHLATSPWFGLSIPKSNLHEMRMELRRADWRTLSHQNPQTALLVGAIDGVLGELEPPFHCWQSLCYEMRCQPLIPTLRTLYEHLKPWENHSTHPLVQGQYCEQVAELLASAPNHLPDLLTYLSVAKLSMAHRFSPDIPHCMTVAQSQGLAFGHVLLPFASAPTKGDSDLRLATSRAIRSLSWISLRGQGAPSWQTILEKGVAHRGR